MFNINTGYYLELLTLETLKSLWSTKSKIIKDETGKNMGKNIGKNINKILSRKLLDHAKQSARDALKTASKGAIQKAAEATSDLIDNKTAQRITKV